MLGDDAGTCNVLHPAGWCPSFPGIACDLPSNRVVYSYGSAIDIGKQRPAKVGNVRLMVDND